MLFIFMDAFLKDASNKRKNIDVEEVEREVLAVETCRSVRNSRYRWAKDLPGVLPRCCTRKRDLYMREHSRGAQKLSWTCGVGEVWVMVGWPICRWPILRLPILTQMSNLQGEKEAKTSAFTLTPWRLPPRGVVYFDFTRNWMSAWRIGA